MKKLSPQANPPLAGDTLSTVFFYFAILIFIIGFNFTDSPPPSGWYQQFMPNLNNQPLSDVYFIDSLIGFAVTNNNLGNDSGYILKTTNGGDNWNIKLYDRRDFSRIKFTNSTTGFISGGTGSGTPYLYKTTNAGENWLIISSFGCAFWDDMSVLNKDTIWLVDHDQLCGGVFRTTNGGLNWTGQAMTNGNPNKIYMYNRNIGFASSGSGPGSVLYKTTNSGTNWFLVTGTEGFTDMRFVDSLTGYKCISLIKKTTDGGLTWVQLTLPSGGNIIGSGMSKISYMSSSGDTLWSLSGSIIVNSGVRGTLYHTKNGGTNWTFQLPDTSIHIPEYYYGSFIDRFHGWNYAVNTGIHTTTGGDTTFYTGIQEMSQNIPKNFILKQNYPNPFNPRTVIPYSLKSAGYVRIIAYDILGREVQRLVDQKQSAGEYEVDFMGKFCSSGVYFYRMTVDDRIIDTKRMLMLK